MLFVARAAVEGPTTLAETLDALTRGGFTGGFELSACPEARAPASKRLLAAWEGRLMATGQAFDPPEAPRWRWALGDRDERRRWGLEAAETIRRAAALGGPWPYGLQPGPWRAPWQQGAMSPDARVALDRWLLAFEPLAALAENRGLRLALDFPADARHPLADPERTGAFLRRLAAPNVGVYWRLGAALEAAHARRQEPALWAAALAPRVLAVGIGRAGGAPGLPPDGAGEWEALPDAVGGEPLPWILEARGLGLDAGAREELEARRLVWGLAARDKHSLSTS